MYFRAVAARCAASCSRERPPGAKRCTHHRQRNCWKFDQRRGGRQSAARPTMEAFSSDGAMADTAISAFIRSRAAFDLKGVMSSLTVLRLRSPRPQPDRAPAAGQGHAVPAVLPQRAPIVLDVGELEGGVAGFPLAALVRALQSAGWCRWRSPTSTTPTARWPLAAGLGIVSLTAARPAGEPDPASDPPKRGVAASGKREHAAARRTRRQQPGARARRVHADPPGASPAAEPLPRRSASPPRPRPARPRVASARPAPAARPGAGRAPRWPPRRRW